MGRLLDIARNVGWVGISHSPQLVRQIEKMDHVAFRTESKAVASCAKSELSAVSGAAVIPAAEWSQPVADVLNVIVRAGQPVLHSQIVIALKERGYNKSAAYAGIGAAQGRGWIEHNLVSGYVLAEKFGEEESHGLTV